MKNSCYNYELREGDYLILYNAAADDVLVLRPEVARIYDDHHAAAEQLRDAHPDLYQELTRRGFLVPKEVDEVQALIDRWEASAQADRSFALTVNPTLDCNMKCWYCYEGHSRQAVMTDEVRLALERYVERLVSSQRYDQLRLGFFGGEPLLRYRQTVLPLLQSARSACEVHGVELAVHFTTNGYLLTQQVLDELRPYSPSLQITLDGNEAVHNSVKRVEGAAGTYRQTVEGVRRALALGLPVGVRFNYTARFLPSFIDVLADFADLSEGERALLNFDFQAVWQDAKNQTAATRETVRQLAAQFREAGFYVNYEDNRPPAFCYADCANHVVVNCDGYLYKCTARDFKPASAEGRLMPDGEVEMNERFARRMALRYADKACRACRAYPLCHGGCTQLKLEHPAGADCIKGYSPEGRDELLRQRALWLVEEAHRQVAGPAQAG